MSYFALDISLMMSVWLVVMVYLSKLATLRQIALIVLYLPITFYYIFVLTFLSQSFVFLAHKVYEFHFLKVLKTN